MIDKAARDFILEQAQKARNRVATLALIPYPTIDDRDEAAREMGKLDMAMLIIDNEIKRLNG